MAVTKDVRITEESHLQYHISAGCNQPVSCTSKLPGLSLSFIELGQHIVRVMIPWRFAISLKLNFLFLKVINHLYFCTLPPPCAIKYFMVINNNKNQKPSIS